MKIKKPDYALLHWARGRTPVISPQEVEAEGSEIQSPLASLSYLGPYLRTNHSLKNQRTPSRSNIGFKSAECSQTKASYGNFHLSLKPFLLKSSLSLPGSCLMPAHWGLLHPSRRSS